MAAANTHTVVWGDTLSQLALKYDTSVYNLQILNGITDPNKIYVGQVLKITSSDSTSTSKPASTNKVNINHFGLQVGTDSTIYAKWEWSKDNTDCYQVEWSYKAGGLWFMGNDSTIGIKDATYSHPANASYVRVRVKPISKTHTVNNKETHYWTAEWCDYVVYDVSKQTPPGDTGVPSVTIEGGRLTAELDNLDIKALEVQFRVVQNDTKIIATPVVRINYGRAYYVLKVSPGYEYKVQARGKNGENYGEWSNFSDNVSSAPAVSSGITVCKANSKTSVYLEWTQALGATKYAIEYTTKKTYFDGSNQTTTINDIKFTHYEITGLEIGQEYFFRIKSLNDDNKESGWSEIASVVLGKAPTAPTTWSSTTTATTDENLTLYWVHNSEDNSRWTFAELELTHQGTTQTITIENTAGEDEEDKTSYHTIVTKDYLETSVIEWRVRTAGITKEYGDWSIQRTVTIYTPPTLEVEITDKDGNALETVTSFPFYVKLLAGPNTQAPIGFHVSIVSNSTYDTTDKFGNETRVKRGDIVYSKQYTPVTTVVKEIVVEMTAGNVDLQNGISYTVIASVGMDSGLTAEMSANIRISWSEYTYVPNAEISIDPESFTANIRPYCTQYVETFHEVILSGANDYKATVGSIAIADDTRFEVGRTSNTDEPVYIGIKPNGEYLYYTVRSSVDLVNNVKLSVYRREYDGTFVEIASDLINNNNTCVTDPHPALDYARYRIVATTVETGAVCYYDMPPYPVNGKSIVIQWDEAWDSFDTTEESAMIEQPWAGSLLKLPYNIDVNEAPKKDVTMVKYAGRTNPVSYYGTHIDTAPSWNAMIDKNDKETIYALRRLAIWKGDVYIREPSGVGYWANVNVSFSQKHCDPAVPVTLDITRVEGGI